MSMSSAQIRNDKNCPFCGSSTLRRYSVQTNDATIGPQPVSVVECRSCITAWQWPQKFTEDNAKEYYKKQYHTAESSKYFDPDYKLGISNIELDFVESVSNGRGSLLDIGAGAGVFVELARSHGWSAHGVDLSFASDFVVQGTVDDISDTYDVITMWDVIEHVEDPEAEISKASKKLTDKGILIIETGNYLSADRILNESDWWAFHPDHRWYHAPVVIERLLRKAGFNQLVYAKKLLRPGAVAPELYGGPRWPAFVAKAAKRPYRSWEYLRQYRDLKVSSERHPQLSQIGIFAVAASRA